MEHTREVRAGQKNRTLAIMVAAALAAGGCGDRGSVGERELIARRTRRGTRAGESRAWTTGAPLRRRGAAGLLRPVVRRSRSAPAE